MIVVAIVTVTVTVIRIWPSCGILAPHPRLVVWGAGFQGNFLDLIKTQKSPPTGTHQYPRTYHYNQVLIAVYLAGAVVLFAGIIMSLIKET